MKDLRVYKKKRQKPMKILEIKLLFKIIFENLENSKMTISRWDQPKSLLQGTSWSIGDQMVLVYLLFM